MSEDPSNNKGQFTRRGRLRLPRTAILRGRKPFNQLFQGGRSLRSPHVDLRYRWVDSANPSVKMAFIVGKRLGVAVFRNRLRRQIREAYRLTAPLLEEVARRKGRALEGAFIAKSRGVQHQELMRVMTGFYQKLGQPPQETSLKP